MPDVFTCSNPKCRTGIDAGGKQVGDSVACPKCGTENRVLASFGSDFDISTFSVPEEGEHILHPARQVCTACGAVLGVRDATCPSCGGDVRTGMTHARITEEQKAKRGLFRRKKKAPAVPTPAARPQPGTVRAARMARAAAPARRVPARRPAVQKSGVSPVLIGVGMAVLALLLAAAGVAIFLLAK